MFTKHHSVFYLLRLQFTGQGADAGAGVRAGERALGKPADVRLPLPPSVHGPGDA